MSRLWLAGEGVGLISTHDLELVVFADELSKVTNYHFQEDVTQGRMIFDYCLRTWSKPNHERITDHAHGRFTGGG